MSSTRRHGAVAETLHTQRADPFARVLGRGRGRVDAATDVLLVEDHGVPGDRTVAVFATRIPQLAEDVAAIHSCSSMRSAGGYPAKVGVRRVSLAEFEAVRESNDELGPGDVDRNTAAEEAIIMRVRWPLCAG